MFFTNKKYYAYNIQWNDRFTQEKPLLLKKRVAYVLLHIEHSLKSRKKEENKHSCNYYGISKSSWHQDITEDITREVKNRHILMYSSNTTLNLNHKKVRLLSQKQMTGRLGVMFEVKGCCNNVVIPKGVSITYLLESGWSTRRSSDRKLIHSIITVTNTYRQ